MVVVQVEGELDSTGEEVKRLWPLKLRELTPLV